MSSDPAEPAAVAANGARKDNNNTSAMQLFAPDPNAEGESVSDLGSKRPMRLLMIPICN